MGCKVVSCVLGGCPRLLRLFNEPYSARSSGWRHGSATKGYWSPPTLGSSSNFWLRCLVHIPNNDLAKVPGVPKGKKYIFVGFSQNKNGFKVFDPERRTYHTVGNCYFYEDFSSRVDALRHHDQRRALMRRGLELEA